MTELTARVVIACHTEDRLTSLKRAIVSAQNQTPPAAQVIVESTTMIGFALSWVG